jgi:hypothetical protein
MSKLYETCYSNTARSSITKKKTIDFDQQHTCDCQGDHCSSSKRVKTAVAAEEPKSLQISESTIELMKDISISEIPGIRGKVARDLFRKGYIHMYFLAREFIYKFEADEIKFQEWLKRNFSLSTVDANRAVRAIRKILFDDNDNLSKQKKALAAAKAEIQNSKKTCRCMQHSSDNGLVCEREQNECDDETN